MEYSPHKVFTLVKFSRHIDQLWTLEGSNSWVACSLYYSITRISTCIMGGILCELWCKYEIEAQSSADSTHASTKIIRRLQMHAGIQLLSNNKSPENMVGEVALTSAMYMDVCQIICSVSDLLWRTDHSLSSLSFFSMAPSSKHMSSGSLRDLYQKFQDRIFMILRILFGM
jgi:hypothetical protein